MFDKDEIMHIFSDADAIDFDSSRWDKRLDLYLFADHTPREGERKGFYRVSFKRVRNLELISKPPTERDDRGARCARRADERAILR